MAKAMRAAKAMKAMKRVSKFAKGKLAKAVAFRGTKTKTYTGLKKTDLFKNKRGKIVSKKASARGKQIKWSAAVEKARAYCKIKGFAAVKKGTYTQQATLKGPPMQCEPQNPFSLPQKNHWEWRKVRKVGMENHRH